MNTDGSNQQRLVSMPSGSAIDPRWSPDGKTIVSANARRRRGRAIGRGSVIFSVEIETGRVKRLSR
jgi:Tol biopolymer transport system component